MQISSVHVQQSTFSVHVDAISILQLKRAYYECKYVHVEARLRLTPFQLLIAFYGWKYVHMEDVWHWKPCVDLITLNTIRQTSSGNKSFLVNPLTPNNHYSGRTAPLTSKRCILYIYSTNTGAEYFKHGIYSPFFSLQNAVCFIILTYLVPVLSAFYIQDVLKFKNIIPAPKG